jgi:hypothetical protein
MIFPTWRWKHRAETDLAEARMARQETRLGELLAAIGKTRASCPESGMRRPTVVWCGKACFPRPETGVLG